MYMNTISLLALAGVAQAHMSLWYPPPLGGAKAANPLTSQVDKEFNFPLGCCGSDGEPTRPSPGLCRGHLDLYDTEEAQVTWKAGEQTYWQMSDHTYDPEAPGGTHSGGSCQVGFSTDRGETWKVAASYHGNCPHGIDGSPEVQTFDFVVPTGMPEGNALFAWIWLNREHEAFMGCSKVKIQGGSGSSPQPSKSSGSSPQPSSSAVASQKPAQSYVASQKPAQSSAAPYVPENNNDDSVPVVTITEIVTATYVAQVTRTEALEAVQTTAPSSSGSSDEDSDDEENSWWQNNNKRSRWSIVDGCKCECRGGEENSLSSSCVCTTCDSPSAKRDVVERKALRMHRRTLKKRVTGCDWNSAPAMEVSYFTVDANCAPNAKMNTPESDTFELGWNVDCGVFDGNGEYPIRMMECNMY